MITNDRSTGEHERIASLRQISGLEEVFRAGSVRKYEDRKRYCEAVIEACGTGRKGQSTKSARTVEDYRRAGRTIGAGDEQAMITRGQELMMTLLIRCGLSKEMAAVETGFLKTNENYLKMAEWLQSRDYKVTLCEIENKTGELI